MKYVLIVPDGMSDQPLAELNGKTPKMVARTPHMDRLAFDGVVGSVLTVPEGMYPGSDVANMAILGHDPRVHRCGRGPLEAAAIGVPMSPRDVAFRCSLISVDGEKIVDHSSGNIASALATELMQLVARKLGTANIRFYPGVGYRHVLVWEGGPADAVCAPPHDIVGEPFREHLPQGDGESVLRRLIDDSLNLLYDHPINRQRMEDGLVPANMIWPWGQGRPPQLESFAKRWGFTGSVIAAVDLVKGIGVLSGLEAPAIAGATGYLDTDFAAKGRAALAALQNQDFVFVHIEAPDEAGHQGDIEGKIRAIEAIDANVVGPIVSEFAEHDFRMMILPDHATPVELRTHTPGPVPFLLCDSRAKQKNTIDFDESAIEDSNLRLDDGTKLLELLLRR